MTDFDAVAREMDLGSAANGRDPLETCGLLTLTAQADLGEVAHCLRSLLPLLPTEALERRVIRNRTIRHLKAIQITDATGLVDAAFPRQLGIDDEAQGQAVAFADPEPWPESVDGGVLLGRIHALVTRFVSLPAGADLLLAVFALYTHVADAFDTASYLVLHSPAPQCGKTRALEILGLLVRRAWQTICPSTAVLFRVLEQHTPTLLLDEAEVVRGRGDGAKDVQALLQSGYRRGGSVPRCVGDDNEVRNFRVFGPKAFALIGELPPALFDRCIKIEMQRRARGERLERFRFRRVVPEGLVLRRMATRWARDHVEALRTSEVPDLPFLDERQEEAWSPLMAIGTLVGGDWLERLKDAACRLSGGRSTTGVGVELLADIRGILLARRAGRLPSADLAAALNELEGHRWADWNHGKGITPNAVARQLRDFGITPGTIRVGDGTAKGYRAEQFEAVFAQYLPSDAPTTVTPSQPGQGGPYLAHGIRNTPQGVTDDRTEMLADSGQSDGVTVQMQEDGGAEGYDAFERAAIRAEGEGYAGVPLLFDAGIPLPPESEGGAA